MAAATQRNGTRRAARGSTCCIRVACLVFFFLAVHLVCGAGRIPSPERLLPDDTLFFATVPDFPRLAAIYRQSPEARLLSDPAMRPFVEKFLGKWKDEFIKPLQRELKVDLESYANLAQGQLTFAVIQNGWQGKDDQSPGLLLLLDTRDKVEQLKANLADFRQKWVDEGKKIRFETIRGAEFFALPMSSNDVPRTLRRFLPQPAVIQELGAEPARPRARPEHELVIGRVESLLVVADSINTAEKIVVQLTGGSAPTLNELAAYQACHLAYFRNAPFYAWANAKTLLDAVGHSVEKKDNPQAPNPFDARPDKLITASGLLGLQTIAFSFEAGNEGALGQLFLGIPEPSRQGIFRVLAGEPKDASPPPSVPTDAVTFQRWRLDGQKSWAALQKLASELPWMSTLSFFIDTAHANARAKDPSFDLNKSLIGNLGDDFITYEKAPRGNTPAERDAPPAITLIGCHKAEHFAAALKALFTLMSQSSGGLREREFLGRKIFSLPQPPLPMPFIGNPRPGIPRTLSYSASAGYAAFSTDEAMLEEYLRSSESQAKTLREIPGLAEAAQKVTGPGTGLFGYENRAETMRISLESLKASIGAPPAAESSSLIASVFGLSSPEASFKDWMDYSLLPAFDRISKYFAFTVYGGSSSIEGLTFKLYAPTPPQLRVVSSEAAKR